MKKFFKRILWILVGLVLMVLGLAIFIWINSPGKTAPFTGADGKPLKGSIAVIEQISLGGVDQHLIIRGTDQQTGNALSAWRPG